MTERAKCSICGEPMPEGEEMFKFHGYSGPCPKPPLPRAEGYDQTELDILRARVELLREAHTMANGALRSAMSVAEREGRETNWPAYRATLRASLEASHAAMQALDSAPRHEPKINRRPPPSNERTGR